MMTFQPSDRPITREWLRANCDRLEEFTPPEVIHKILPNVAPFISYTAVFEVEADHDGGFDVRVGFTDTPHPDESFDIELETRCDEDKTRLGAGLYRKHDDLLALLEILARGNHFK